MRSFRHWWAAAGLAGCAAVAQAQGFEGCVQPQEGTAFSLPQANNSAPIQGVVMGRGERAVVFSNTAYNAPCEWLPLARELVAKGWQVALWRYGSGGLEQIAHLSAVVGQVRSNGARKVVLLGGSRGGCLSMMTAAEIAPPPAGVVLLSCAAVFNRRSPTPTAAWVAKTRVPVLHVTGENDTIPTLDEARAEFAAFPVQDKKLVIVPKTYAHGDQLLAAPDAAGTTRPEVMEFLERVTR